MGRIPKIIVAYAKKGGGKSFTTMKMMRETVAGNPAKGVAPRRCLILDVNDEFVDIPALDIKDIDLFSVHNIIEIRRIRPFLMDEKGKSKRMTLDDIANTLFYILEHFRNGLFLIEDINRYVSDTMPNDLIGAICTNRHIGVDMVIHYQSIGRITSKVWQNVNLLRIHKITDTVARHKKKFEDKFEYLSIAEIIVNRRYDNGYKRFFLYADVDEEVLTGGYSQKEFEKAVDDFISIEHKSLVNPLLNAMNEHGKKKYTPQQAYQLVRERLLSYNGNKSNA